MKYSLNKQNKEIKTFLLQERHTKSMTRSARSKDLHPIESLYYDFKEKVHEKSISTEEEQLPFEKVEIT